MSRAARVVVGTLVLVALHVVNALPLPFEAAPPLKSAWPALLVPNADILGIVLFGVVLGARLSWRGVAHVAVVLFCLVYVYRCFDALVPAFYGKPFEPWVDALEFPGLVHLFLHEHTAFVQVLLVLALVAALVVVYYVLWRAFCAVVRVSDGPVFASACCVAYGLALALAWEQQDEGGPQSLPRPRPSMLAKALEYGIDVTAARGFFVGPIVEERLRAAAKRIEAAPRRLEQLRDVDVYVLFLESYGRGILATSAVESYTRALGHHEAVLAADGWRARSGWLRPSVRGGGSSLAHLEFLSGIEIENRRVFDAVLASRYEALPTILRAQGHRTVNVEPAMPRAWPEAASMGFEVELFRSSFAYEGTRYAWGDMPDQFALATVLRDVVQAPREAPLFLQYVSVTGHAPFSKIPPFLDPWPRALEAGAFDGEPSQKYDITWMNYATHPRVKDAYVAAMLYSLQVAFAFAQRLERPSLVMILGDHQAPLDYTDHFERLHDVPLHVLSKEARLVDAWSGEAWLGRAGLLPDFDAASLPSPRFLQRFLTVYGR